jgi:hypothetical protein
MGNAWPPQWRQAGDCESGVSSLWTGNDQRQQRRQSAPGNIGSSFFRRADARHDEFVRSSVIQHFIDSSIQQQLHFY